MLPKLMKPTQKNKMYSIIQNDKIINFGDSRYT